MSLYQEFADHAEARRRRRLTRQQFRFRAQRAYRRHRLLWLAAFFLLCAALACLPLLAAMGWLR